MNRSSIVAGVAALAAVLLLMALAYSHSQKVESLYDERMHRDIQAFTQQLAQAGVPEAQVKAYRTVLLEMNRNTIAYVSSEIWSLTGAFSTMVIVVSGVGIALAVRARPRRDDGGVSS
jgi:predicted PurR-regulated permease PerM